MDSGIRVSNFFTGNNAQLPLASGKSLKIVLNPLQGKKNLWLIRRFNFKYNIPGLVKESVF